MNFLKKYIQKEIAKSFQALSAKTDAWCIATNEKLELDRIKCAIDNQRKEDKADSENKQNRESHKRHAAQVELYLATMNKILETKL